MNTLTRNRAAIVANAIIAILEVIAFIICFSCNGVSMLLYYTQCSNAFAGLVSLVYVIVAIKNKNWYKEWNGSQSASRVLHMLRYLATCTLMITFCVVLFVLGPNPASGGLAFMFFNGLFPIVHLTAPLLCLLSFCVFERTEDPSYKLGRKDALISLVPSCLYAAILYPLNIFELMKGPYPFLMVNEMPVWMSIAWFIGLLVAFYVIGRVLGILNGRRVKE